MPRLTTEERLQVHTRKTSGCWIWTGPLNSCGYGRIWMTGLGRVLVHRWVWIRTYGKIPRDKEVMHSCDRRNCINPEHLLLGTHQENIDDKMAKGRHRVPLGEENPATKLSRAQIKAIRRLIARDMKDREISVQFKVSRKTVSAIRRRKTWSHVA